MAGQMDGERVVEMGGERVLLCAEGGPLLDAEQGMVDLIGAAFSQGATRIAVPVARLSPSFFDLRSGLAGAMAQKAVQYQCGLAIVGDIGPYLVASRALRAWVAECNRTGEICFLESLDALVARRVTRPQCRSASTQPAHS